MPQIKAASKALRTDKRRRAVNDRWRRKMREALHAVRDAILAKDSKEAKKALVSAESVLDRVARRNIIHPNKAARKKSRLVKAVSKI